MNKYRDWQPTIEHPTIEDQVAFDLLDEMSVPKEVLNRLADKEAGITDILKHYKYHMQAEYQKQLAKTIAAAATTSAGEMLAPVIEKWLEKLILPPPSMVFPSIVLTHDPNPGRNV